MPNIEFENIFDRIKNIVNDLLNKVTNIDKQVDFLNNIKIILLEYQLEQNIPFEFWESNNR